MIKKIDNFSIMEMVEDTLLGIAKVKNISVTLKKFYKFKYSTPRPYNPGKIQKLRKKFHISQSVLACLLNTKLSTVQKWESGVNVPNGPANRLLQILETQGPRAFESPNK